MAIIQKRVDAPKALTIYKVTGKISGDEVQDAIREFYEGEATIKVFWDLTQCDERGTYGTRSP